MAYNSYYPMNYGAYQVPQSNYFQNGTSSQQQNGNGMIWVVGENGADSYLVAPGQTVQLWDSTAPVFYLKTADNMGRPSKRVFDYTERSGAPQMPISEPHSDYASREDVDYLKAEIEALRAKFDDIEGSKK